MAKTKVSQADDDSFVIPISKILIPENTRDPGWEKNIGELQASIKEVGLICPIMVAPLAAPVDGLDYELVYGQRRLEACRNLKHTTIKALIGPKKMSQKDKFVAKLIENKDREDLSAMEDARAYKRALEEFGCTAKELAKKLGVSDGNISQRLALLKMPDAVKMAVETGKISATHAREINRVKDSEQQEKLVEKAASMPGPLFKTYVEENVLKNKKAKRSKTAKNEVPAPATGTRSKKEATTMMGQLDKATKKAVDAGERERAAHLKGIIKGISWAMKLGKAKMPV